MDSGLCTWSVATSRRKHLGTGPGGHNYRKWRKFYHFDVYWPSDSAGGTNMGSRSHMRPFIHGSIVTGSAQDINGSVIRAPTLHVQFSLRDHQTSCTLDCPLRRHPRTQMVADVRPRLSWIFNSI